MGNSNRYTNNRQVNSQDLYGFWTCKGHRLLSSGGHWPQRQQNRCDAHRDHGHQKPSTRPCHSPHLLTDLRGHGIVQKRGKTSLAALDGPSSRLSSSYDITPLSHGLAHGWPDASLARPSCRASHWPELLAYRVVVVPR